MNKVRFYKGKAGKSAYKVTTTWKLGTHIFMNGECLILRVCYLRNKKGTHYIEMSIKVRECCDCIG